MHHQNVMLTYCINCVLSDCPMCMQHKASNFKFIYFLEEIKNKK